MGAGCVNSPPRGTPAAYCGLRDDAYVYPALVGRLTAADSRMHSTAAASAAVLVSPSGSRGAGRRGGGPDQKVEWR